MRIIGVPDLIGMAEECLKESLPVFQHFVGTYKRTARFDEFGCAWIDFSIAKGNSQRMHGVAIEPFLLQLPRTRREPKGRKARTD